MPWYGYLLSALGLAWGGWLSTAVIGLQIGLADVKRRQTEQDEQCAGHMVRSNKVEERLEKICDTVARIDGRLGALDFQSLVQALQRTQSEGES